MHSKTLDGPIKKWLVNSFHVKEMLYTSKNVWIHQKEVLERCLVGVLVGTWDKSETATLSDTRRWSSSTCSQVHGMNIYEMGDEDSFLNFHLKLG